MKKGTKQNKLQKYILPAFFGLASLGMMVLPTYAMAQTPVYFTLAPDSTHHQMARLGLADLLEEKEPQIGRQATIGLARADLNDDGVQELFVRLLDPELFCDDEECDTYVFAVIGSDMTKIGQFRTRTIDILDTQNDGARDLSLTLQDGTQHIARWNVSQYETANAEGTAE